MSKPKIRTLEEIKADYPFVVEKGQEIREVFGTYAKCKVFDDGELVYSWEKKEPFREPTNLLPDDREPHLWNAGLRRKR